MIDKRNGSKLHAQAHQPATQAAPKIPKFHSSNQPQNQGTGSQGQTSSGPDPTPGGGRGSRPYEFDSCISTEEAFFAPNEEHKWPVFRQGEDRSNQQEDGSTPPQASLLRNY